jgi:hypothetical protein
MVKKKVGRPSLPPEERRRHRVMVWLRESEYSALESIAIEKEMTVSTATRDILVRALGRRGVR